MKSCGICVRQAEKPYSHIFCPMEKDGGTYVDAVGTIKKIDPLEGRVILTDGTAIPIEDILEVEAPILGQDL